MARILIVEDEPDIALGLEMDLRDEGYEVEIVSDGVEATQRGKQPGWDLILLDVMLPRRDGFDVCRDLRRAKIGTPILMLTAKVQEAEKVMGLDFGADDSPSLSVRGNCKREFAPCCVERPRRSLKGSNTSENAKWIWTALRYGKLESAPT